MQNHVTPKEAFDQVMTRIKEIVNEPESQKICVDLAKAGIAPEAIRDLITRIAIVSTYHNPRYADALNKFREEGLQ